MTLEQFGELFDPVASSNIVSKRERGVSIPSPSRIKKLAELSEKSVDDILTPRTDELFLGQLHAIENYYTEHREDFEQDLSNFYLIKNHKFLNAGMVKDRKVITRIEDLF
ncbi:hypothetical protein [Listeria goaensis]|uniref:hypothetical protein n=1 Tax=Listeria goaensis TaxID=1649188 RepID=UPI0013C2FA2C|nr:hypothetical protein [Listeria goaensis]